MTEPVLTMIPPPGLDQPWTERRLGEFARARLGPRKLIVVSNREPYENVQSDGEISWIRPAGGLTFALDPVLQACGGTWIAHGSGSADREVTDDEGRVRVPPADPRYVLRRVWLTKEEEEGYYYGFANRALWPLCHVAYTRPFFQREQWEHYAAVNRKFADAVKCEIGDDPALVFVQDYHLALLPRIIRQEAPNALVIQFWHIPWPNPEAFRICPWKREILDGLLGNHLLGFQIRYECTNFLDTIDRELEARADREGFEVSYRDQVTHVGAYPISVNFGGISARASSPETQRQALRLRRKHRLDGKLVAVGVDRMDYTKGIPERLRAVDRFLTRYPSYRGKFVLVQIGAPSRTHIDEYQRLGDEIASLSEEINWRHKTYGWSPVILIQENTPPEIVSAYFQIANVCLVTSLHDGMNLVAKEFVASRPDLHGVLILSPFTGSARELGPALQVNPYAIDDLADAIRRALEMTPEEQERRMTQLRERVREANVYRWAATILEDAARLL